MAADGIHVADEGIRLNFPFVDENGAVLDISAATTKQVTFKKGNTTGNARTLIFDTDGVDGLTHYYVVAADFASAGTYFAQAYIVLPAAGAIPIRKLHSKIVQIEVKGNN